MNPPSSSLRILIVDDQREVRQMIRAALESQFPTASFQDVPSAEEAMILLSQNAFNLLVVDIRLAGMSGLEMVEKIRRRQPDLNIVVVTGLGDPAIENQLAQAPIQAWFRKPLPMEDFLVCVTNLLAGSATALPSSKAEPEPVEIDRGAEQSNMWDDVCDRLALCGLWIADRQGHLLAQSTHVPTSLAFPRLVEYFSEAETAMRKLQDRYGAGNFAPLAFYLSEDCIASQLNLEQYRIIFCGKKSLLPAQPLALQINLLQKAQGLLEILGENPSILNQRPSREHLMVEEVTPDAELERLLQDPSLNPDQLEQVDEFWEQSMSTEGWAESSEDSQTFHLGQARQLGLLADEEDKDPLKG